MEVPHLTEPPFCLTAQGHFLCDRNLFIIAGKGMFHQFLIRFSREQAHDWNQNQPGQHGKCAAVDGRLQKAGEIRAEEQIQKHDTGTKQE